jgi:HAD superfamily hydrolase (TIGR01509 family)
MPNYIPFGHMLRVSKKTKAVLFDLDGVIIDSLTPDVEFANEYIKSRFGEEVFLDRDFIRSIFGHQPKDFPALILDEVEYRFYKPAAGYDDDLRDFYRQKRAQTKFSWHPGIKEIFEDMRKIGMPKMLVSNNPMKALTKIVKNSGLLKEFPQFVGSDLRVCGVQVRPKPEPDMYEYACHLLGVKPKETVVIEDSLIGAEAAKKAGCYTIGVATGSCTGRELLESSFIDEAYQDFSEETKLQCAKNT